MHSLYQAFAESDPGTSAFQQEIQKLQTIEEKVCGIPERLNIGCVCLSTAPIKDSLHGLAVAWKTRYSTQLHEEAKVNPSVSFLNKRILCCFTLNCVVYFIVYIYFIVYLIYFICNLLN